MSKPESEAGGETRIERKPYVQPQIESERVIEKQLMVQCYVADEGCAQDPPQTA